MRRKSNWFKIGIPILAVILAALVGALLIWAIGGNPKTAFTYLLQGAFGTKNNIGETFVQAVPLIFTGLAATFAYRCGVFNLGAEGQFIMGSVASFVVSYSLPGWPTPLVLVLSMLAGALAGGLWAAIAGLLKVFRGLNEMIITIMLNYVAVLFMGYFYSVPFREGSVPQTAAVVHKLSRFISGTRVHTGLLIGLALAGILYYYLFYTAGGLKLRAVGLNATAARFNGFSVNRMMLMSFIVSGAIAGLGGAVELHGTQFRLMSGYGNGYGFDGVAIALIGQLNPLGTVGVAYLFAVLRKGATTMQVGTGMPTAVIDIIQALIIIFAVAGTAFINLPKIRQFLVEREGLSRGRKKKEKGEQKIGNHI